MVDDEPVQWWWTHFKYFIYVLFLGAVLGTVVWMTPIVLQHLSWSPNALRPACTDMAARIKMDHSVPLYVLLDVCRALRDIDLALMPDMAAFNRVAALVSKSLRDNNERLRL